MPHSFFHILFLCLGTILIFGIPSPCLSCALGISYPFRPPYPFSRCAPDISCTFRPLYPFSRLNYYPCQGQSALSMPNFNEASLSDTLQLVYSYKILWETGYLIPFYIGHYYNNQSSHQWLLLLRKKLPISLI